jgi:hypothetical protein
MKITKSQLQKIIKEELLKEAGRPHSMRSGRTMADLDADAATRETDFLNPDEEAAAPFAIGEKVLEFLTSQLGVREEEAPGTLRMIADRLEGK